MGIKVNDSCPPRPSDRIEKGNPPLYKDKRQHKIDLRIKIGKIKEEIAVLKSITTENEKKKEEIETKIFRLKSRLKECQMEKEAIDQYNHTQFIKNIKNSREAEARFDNESNEKRDFFEANQIDKTRQDNDESQENGFSLVDDANELGSAAEEKSERNSDNQPEPHAEDTIEINPNTMV